MEMTVLVWILTYAIHSTVLIVAVWLLTKLFSKMSLSTEESLWKAAILGGIATATLQLASGASPPWGHFSLPAQLDTDPVVMVSEPVAAREEATGVVQRKIVKHDSGDLTITTIRDAKPAAAAARLVTKEQPMEPSAWPWVLLGLVAFGSVFALVRLALSARRLKAKLQARRQVIEDPVLESFLALCEKAEFKSKKRVKLTASAHLRSPVALFSREVVLPERALERLSPQQQEGMVAHEIAHIMRRDPAWSVLTAMVEALFFFQPLNHLARRKLQEVAEFQCDDWAARNTGTGVHLAKCLAEVAGWLEDGPVTSPIAVSMADDGSPIVRRITRLLHGKRARSKEDGSHTWFALRVGTTLGLLGIVAWLVPGVSREAHRVEGEAKPGGSPNAYASAMQVERSRGIGEIVVRDLDGETGRKRSQVRIEGKDEVVRVEVERDPPPPPPEPSDDGDSLSITIHGGIFDPFPFGGWGWLDLDIEVGDVEIEGLFEGCMDHHCGRHTWTDHLEDIADRAERDRKRTLRALEREKARALRDAVRHRERAHRDAERARRHAERARQRAEDARDRARSAHKQHKADDDSLFSI